MKEKWKLRLPNLIALIMIICAVVSWFFPDIYYREYDLLLKRTKGMEYNIPQNALIPEKDALLGVQAVIKEREKLLHYGQYNAHTIEQLLRRLDWLVDHVQLAERDYPQEFPCDMECVPMFIYDIRQLSYLLDRDRAAFCNSKDGLAVCLAYANERHALRPKLVESASIEMVGLLRYKLTRASIFVLLALVVWLYGRGQRVGYSFGSLFGNKLPRVFSYLVAIGFSFCGNTAAVAQQILKKLNQKQSTEVTERYKTDSDDHTFKLPPAQPSFAWHVGTEVYPVTFGPNSGPMVSPNYNFSAVLKRLGGLRIFGSGFAELGVRKNQFFTNHGVNVAWKNWAAPVTIETCRDWLATCVQLGSKVQWTKVWGVQKILSPGFKSLLAGPLWRIRGPTHWTEIYWAWVTRELRLPKGFSVNSEGFMRFRIGPKPAVGEPQVILRHRRLPNWQQITEFWMVGTDPTVRFGFQYTH